MSIITAPFILFVFALLILYYLVPRRFQYLVLLAGSLFFYLLSGVRTSVWILFTATSVYAASRWMQKLSDTQKAFFRENKATLSKEEKAIRKNRTRRQRRAIMVLTLLVNIGILCTFKYLHFLVDQWNALISRTGFTPLENSFTLIVPLGISFYTFQAIGYLVDVYWENVEAERSYLKMLLFVSFFPQITQGPISAYDDLSRELFTPHEFTYRNYSRGFTRMLWGLMKKMVLANLLAPYVTAIFSGYMKYTGLTVLIGAMGYSVQIYADFSGYMDIMCGVCEMLGIRLTENFDRPYFSKSIAEYWRRWHISLGTHFKRYIYYPIAVSRWNQKLGKNAGRRFGKNVARSLPASIALVGVWLVTGLWHGASWAYIAWGGVNGLFIIFSLWMEPVYEKTRSALHIREDAGWFRAFRVLRTFLLVTFIKVLPEVGTLSDGLGLIGRIFTNHTLPRTVKALFPYPSRWFFVPAIFIALALLILVSLLQRRGSVRDRLEKWPVAIRILLLVLLFFFTVAFGVPASNNMRGFMYAQF